MSLHNSKKLKITPKMVHPRKNVRLRVDYKNIKINWIISDLTRAFKEMCFHLPKPHRSNCRKIDQL